MWIEIVTSPCASLSVPVTSLAEVWIEIEAEAEQLRKKVVTSLAEVWIEIVTPSWVRLSIPSLPLRKCGLKF